MIKEAYLSREFFRAFRDKGLNIDEVETHSIFDKEGYTYSVPTYQTMLAWLRENKDNYAYPVYDGETLTDECFVGGSLIDDFRKAMEE